MTQPTIWVGAPDDIRTGTAALDAIRTENDAIYYDPAYGVVRVPRDRWRKAQHYELRGWLQCWVGHTNDRSAEHATIFNNYKDLKLDLGSVCEIGCGPFTQLKQIIAGRTASRITLLDPLIHSYLRLANCPYRTGKFAGTRAHLRAEMAEALRDFAAYDTIICINVLEHVMDAPLVLSNLRRSLKAGGTLVFGERAFDDYDPHTSFDIGHPIHIKRVLFDGFRKLFTPVYDNGTYFIGVR